MAILTQIINRNQYNLQKTVENDLYKEFDRQVAMFIHKKYPELAGILVDDFLDVVKPLKNNLAGLNLPTFDLENGVLPFIIVIKNSLVSIEKAMSTIERGESHGIIKLYPRAATDFLPISSMTIPAHPAYLIVNIDRGKETLNIAPDKALQILRQKNRSPLTIDEGIALLTQFPDFIMKNHCFSLLGSRIAGDKRVPALWINKNKQPNLGWCWEGNPHTWLGSASCMDRLS